MMAKAAESLNRAGLPLHEVEGPSLQQVVLGISIDGERGEIRPNPQRIWRLKLGVAALLRKSHTNGKALQILLGHFVHAFLLVRPCLSVFRACYSFITKHPVKMAEIWPQVRVELRHAAALLPLVRASIRRGWSPTVMCSDAAREGLQYTAVTSIP